MVSMRRPAISDTRAVHERTGWPSTSTVHAPHCPSPHPYLAPVRPSVSRSSQSSFESGWTSTVRGAPFTVSVTEAFPNYTPTAGSMGEFHRA